MEDRISARRHAASVRRVASQHQAARLSLTDPLFNVREILKQMVLLEDHLAHPYKLCPDCVRKHLLTIEALGDEGVSLDATGDWAPTCEAMSEIARKWMEMFHDKVPPADMAKDVRYFRKLLAPSACDPRSVVNRIASAYLVKQGPHQH